MINKSVLDAAYKLAKGTYTATSHAEAKDKLQSEFPNISWDEIAEAYLKGAELVEKCYEIGEAARQNNIPDAQAIEMLKERFPGFSNQTYHDALTLGWFLSR